MNRKLFASLIVLLVAASLVLSACQPAAPAEPVVEEPAAEEPAAEEAAEEIELRWRTRPDNQAEIDVYSSISE